LHVWRTHMQRSINALFYCRGRTGKSSHGLGLKKNNFVGCSYDALLSHYVEKCSKYVDLKAVFRDPVGSEPFWSDLDPNPDIWDRIQFQIRILALIYDPISTFLVYVKAINTFGISVDDLFGS
jgi:hypothetical protein